MGFELVQHLAEKNVSKTIRLICNIFLYKNCVIFGRFLILEHAT